MKRYDIYQIKRTVKLPTEFGMVTLHAGTPVAIWTIHPDGTASILCLTAASPRISTSHLKVNEDFESFEYRQVRKMVLTSMIEVGHEIIVKDFSQAMGVTIL